MRPAGYAECRYVRYKSGILSQKVGSGQVIEPLGCRPRHFWGTILFEPPSQTSFEITTRAGTGPNAEGARASERVRVRGTISLVLATKTCEMKAFSFFFCHVLAFEPCTHEQCWERATLPLLWVQVNRWRGGSRVRQRVSSMVWSIVVMIVVLSAHSHHG